MRVPEAKPDRDTDIAVTASDSYARLRELFARVAELAESEREAWIEANVEDAEERAALANLLKADRCEDGYLDLSPMSTPRAWMSTNRCVMTA